MSKRRCRLAMRVSKSDKTLLAFFKGGGRKGNFYPTLYSRLQAFFANEETVDLPAKQPAEPVYFNLWFDLADPLHVDIKTKLAMCNYSEEVKKFILDFAVDYAKRNTPTASVNAHPAKPRKAKKTPVPAQQTEIVAIENHSSEKIALSELSFGSNADPEFRLRFLELALASHPDVSPGGGRKVLKWARAIEEYLSETTGDAPAELEAASDKQSFVYDFVQECPYLGTLQEKAMTRSNVAPAMKVKGKVEIGKDSHKDKGKKDFTQALLGMSSE
ncbi:hypothetical protein [Pseudodesulfovibrio pelocollis]|uniref:hypothetical protein n=1 Tax=Pseudodesulfovibrio pelocollis TaxID=3051432 RepID=UPI00255AC9F5|nr:hypothetical protein [Pseudodesulfovibrio sp. SB368]